MATKKEKSWHFDTNAEALKKLAFLEAKNPNTYEVVRNRGLDGRLAPGWVVRKRK
jgi:hypothetical protein